MMHRHFIEACVAHVRLKFWAFVTGTAWFQRRWNAGKIKPKYIAKTWKYTNARGQHASLFLALADAITRRAEQ